MDAGIRDNFGFSVTHRFLYTMRAWIQHNTSGVMVVQVRDQRKDIDNDGEDGLSIIHRLTSPLGNVYGNFMKAQDFNNDQLLSSLQAWLQVPIYYEELQMEQRGNTSVSMSWHLTALEKRTIEESVEKLENQKALERIVNIMDGQIYN